MAGIVFFRTESRDRVLEFYVERLNATVWLEQVGCTILKHGNLLVGFCDGDITETDGIITLYYDDRDTVDARYDELADVAHGPPTYNEDYDIYQFFANDPDGRTVELQTFEHELPGP